MFIIDNSYDIIEAAINGETITKHPYGFQLEWISPETGVEAAVQALHRYEKEESIMRELGEVFLIIETGNAYPELLSYLEKTTTSNPKRPKTALENRCLPLTYTMMLRAISTTPDIFTTNEQLETYLSFLLCDANELPETAALRQAKYDVEYLIPQQKIIPAQNKLERILEKRYLTQK